MHAVVKRGVRQMSSKAASVGTFDLQESFPRLPVPALADTCARYLKSMEPVLLPEQHEKTTEIVKRFLQNEGPVLHKKLEAYAATQHNWLERWWDKEGYYGGRYPIAITTNPGVVLDDSPVVASLPKDRAQTWRAAQLIHSSMEFMLAVQNNQLPPDTNMCMNQYARLFAMARIPHAQTDRLIAYLPRPNALKIPHFLTEYDTVSPPPSHVVVICEGIYFKVQALTGDASAPRDLLELEAEIDGILRVCNEIKGESSVGVGNLTAVERDTWAKARAALLDASPVNKATLETIQQALFVFVLDPCSPTTPTELARETMMGDGKRRFFDKHSAIVYANGQAGINFEHGATDGLTLVRLADYMSAHKSNTATPPPKITSTRTPTPLPWVLPPNIANTITHATFSYELQKKAVDIDVRFFSDFGRDMIKTLKSSPDAFFQMAIQLGYYRLFGMCVPTYESAATRQFLHGRTETLRSCTSASRDFVSAMDRPGILGERKLVMQRSLLRRALQTHSNNIRDATKGQGCDRHLLGLQMIDPELAAKSEIFQDPALSYGRSWQLSTSSMPTNEVVAFGAVVDNGFGVYYCFPKCGKQIKYCVTSYHGNNRPAVLLSDHIADAMRDMARVLSSEASL